LFRLFLAVVLLLIAGGFVIAGKQDVDGVMVSFRKWALVPFGLGVLFLLWSAVRIIGPGQVGIPVTFGTVGTPVGPGTHLVVPWAEVHRMNIRTQTYTMSVANNEGNKQGDDAIDATTKDGALVRADATIVYHLQENKAGDVFRHLGTSYTELLRSTSRTAIRGAFGSYDAIPAATVQRKEVSRDIEKELIDNLGSRGIVVEAFQLRNVGLPQRLQDAVNARLTAQQQAEQQQFALLKAQKQAEVRIAEANGLAEAQRIIQSTLTPAYLQYLYTKNLEAMSKSPNHSTIIVPFDKNLTPLLNIGDK
jgi:regulator of protease activity HflC (stomatin/prohibitin superfamily)